jgi:hypothetical protein
VRAANPDLLPVPDRDVQWPVRSPLASPPRVPKRPTATAATIAAVTITTTTTGTTTHPPTHQRSYYHNIGPPNDPGGCMHVNTANAAKPTSLFKFVTEQGYNTGLFGKVTNDQGSILNQITAAEAATYIDSPLE